MHRKKINISTVLAGQRLGIKEVDEGIWLVSFMDYDLGYIDLEQKTLQPLDNPFGPKVVTHVLGTTGLTLDRMAVFFILAWQPPLLGRAEPSTPEARRGAPMARGVDGESACRVIMGPRHECVE